MHLSSCYLHDKNTTPTSKSDSTNGISIESEFEVIRDHSHGTQEENHCQQRTVVLPSTTFMESIASKNLVHHSISTDPELDVEDLLTEAHDAIKELK